MTAIEVGTSGDLWLRDTLGHEVGPVLTKAEAHEVTAKIKSYAGVAWILLLEAHNRQAHKAMGYATWSDYVLAEFDMSRSRSYQLISQAKVVIELSAAVSTDVDNDVSTLVDISEREARDLAPVIDEAKAAIVEATDDLPPTATDEDKAAAVRNALDGLRSAAVAKRKREQAPKIEPEAPRREDGDASEEASVAHSGSLTAEGGGPGGGESPAPPPSVQLDPTLSYRAKFSAERSKVRSGLFLFDVERAVETSDDIKALTDFAADLIDYGQRLVAAASGSRLKAVN